MTLVADTPHGDARIHLDEVEGARAAVVLGHGAGGGVEAPDLTVAAEVATSEGITAARVEQPYRVAGRRSPAPVKQLDAAWVAVLERLRERELSGLALIVGGRSLGARIACRTLDVTGGVAVLCLAFPLQPPARKGKERSPSRIDELEAVTAPMLIVQGESDPFGMPPEAPGREVARVPGNHSLRKDVGEVGAAVRAWLPGVAAGASAPA